MVEVAVERNLYEEAEARLGRRLSPGERCIDLAENDAILEDAKAALHEAIEKEKRRSIRKFLRGEKHDLRITPEMVSILAGLRRAGRAAAEAEVERATRAEPTRAMAAVIPPEERWEIRMVFDSKGKQTGYRIYDKVVGEFIQSFGTGEFAMAQGFIDGLINKAHLAAAKSPPIRWVVEQWGINGLWWALPEGKIGSAVRVDNETAGVKLARLKNQEQGLTGGIGIHIIPDDPLRTAISVAERSASVSPVQRWKVIVNDRGWHVYDNVLEKTVYGPVTNGADAQSYRDALVRQAAHPSAGIASPANPFVKAGPSGAWDVVNDRGSVIARFRPGLTYPDPKKAAIEWAERGGMLPGTVTPSSLPPSAVNAARFTLTHSARGWVILDELGNPWEEGFGSGDTGYSAAKARLDSVRAAKAAPPTPSGGDYFVHEVLNGWNVVDPQGQIVERFPRGSAEKLRAERFAAVANDQKRQNLDFNAAAIRRVAEAGGSPGSPIDWIVDYDYNLGKYVVRDNLGHPVAGAKWDNQEDAIHWLNQQAGLAPPGPPQIRGKTEVLGFHPGQAQPFLPHESVIAAERERLIQEGILRGVARTMSPNQMLLFDPQMYPLMDAFNMQLRGITKRITKEGSAQIVFNQDAAVSALARAIDKKVPGALDAAGRMVSGPFNKGLGDVFKRKGGLFTKWQYSAVMDKATCEVCAYFDSTIYYSWRSIAELATSPLPDGGPNPGCHGHNRCRCRPVPYFGEGHVGDVDESLRPITSGSSPEEDAISQATLGGNLTDLGSGTSSKTFTDMIPGPDGQPMKVMVKPEYGLYDGRIHDAVRDYGDVDHEEAAWLLSKHVQGDGLALRLPPGQVKDVHFKAGLLDDYDDVDSRAFVSYWVPNSSPAGIYGGTDEEVRGLGFFDAITGQHDRHGANGLVDRDGNFWTIDNGLSFPEYTNGPSPWNTSSFDTYAARLGPTLSEPEMGILRKLTTDRRSIDAELSPYLNRDELDSMWERISTMLDTGQLVDATGNPIY